MLSRLWLTAAVLVLSFSAHAVAQESAQAKQEVSQMAKEHKSATLEHLNWQTKIMKRKAEHRLALAALASLRADILKHEAELELISMKAMTHQNEMVVHDHAIVEHEDHGNGEHHNKLKKEHAEFMVDHKEMKKEIDASTSHHTELIDAIMELQEKHESEFREHGMGDSDKGEKGKASAIAPSRMKAVVIAVGQNGDKFAIMAGTDDGLRKGHEMDVVRSDRFIGVGVVVAAENNRSVLSTVKEFMTDTVREGDTVMTSK